MKAFERKVINVTPVTMTVASIDGISVQTMALR